jgi:hypothetical protein
LVLIFCFLFFVLPSGVFPESQDAARCSVELFHEKQREQGVNVGPDTPWAMEDYAVACHARLKPIEDLMLRVFDAAGKVFEVIWPDVPAPKEVGELTTWLSRAPGRVDEWRASATRAGAEMALSFVLSWYDEIQLNQLESRHAGAVFPEGMRDRAIAIAAYAEVDEFIADPNAPASDGAGDEEEMDAADEDPEDLGGDDDMSGGGG